VKNIHQALSSRGGGKNKTEYESVREVNPFKPKLKENENIYPGHIRPDYL
jgi:hypothetical protein